MFHRMTRALSAATVLSLAMLPSALADALPSPTGRVILTISGAITATNDNGTAAFDRAALESLPATTFTTTTPWTDGVHTFEGVLLRDLLDAVGASGSTITATALNEYAVEIPIFDASTDGALIAYRRDGAPMPVRDKGPLWIVFPFDSAPRYHSEIVHSRSIWQLVSLDVAP